MNLDTIVPTLDNCSSTLLVSCNAESPNEKICVTFVDYDGSVFTNLEIEPGKTVTLPIPTREGYRFVGWSLTKGGSDLFDFSTPIVDDITLYSVWRDRSLVHVSFYDGQKLIKDGYYKAGEKYRFPSVDYLGEEFTVYGWIKEGDSKIVTGAFFELLYSEEEINFKVYITTYFLSIDMNGVIEMTDYLKLETEVYHHFNIPNSLNGIPVTSIGGEAFRKSYFLSRITIPDSVTSIGRDAFSECANLSQINVSENNKCYKSIDGVLFDRTGKTIICYPKGKTESEYSIPESVTSIGDRAFYGCKGLTSINIPNFVTSIGDRAFYKCSGLTSINIPNSVTSIGDGAFFGCKGLTSINIPDSVTSIGDGAFFGCKGLMSINIPDSVTSIGDRSFSKCKSLTSIVIPDSVTSIGDEAFSWCESLTSIVIPDSVTSIGRYAFEACEKLSEIHINKTINSIPYAPWRGNIMIDEEANDVLKDVDIIWSDETVSYYDFNRYREFYD